MCAQTGFGVQLTSGEAATVRIDMSRCTLVPSVGDGGDVTNVYAGSLVASDGYHQLLEANAWQTADYPVCLGQAVCVH